MGPDSDGRVESAMGQAKALQQLLVRTAYALHLCAENAATAHERLVTNIVPTSTRRQAGPTEAATSRNPQARS